MPLVVLYSGGQDALFYGASCFLVCLGQLVCGLASCFAYSCGGVDLWSQLEGEAIVSMWIWLHPFWALHAVLGS